jgi:hypothetical protein
MLIAPTRRLPALVLCAIYRQARLKRWLEEREFLSRFPWLAKMNALDWAHDPTAFDRLPRSRATTGDQPGNRALSR